MKAIEGIGTLRYDPYRGDMKRRTKWWLVADVDKEITRYYRWWVRRTHHIILEQPAWDAHISIIRGEDACSKKSHLWNKYSGERVNFSYSPQTIHCAPDPNHGGHFWWINVKCSRMDQIRKEFDLPVGWNFHITFGRTYY